MRVLAPGAALTVLALLAAGSSRAADMLNTGLEPFDVISREFDPMGSIASGRVDVLPVDSPDEGHAVAPTTADAASFTKEADGGRPLPAVSTCIEIELRP